MTEQRYDTDLVIAQDERESGVTWSGTVTVTKDAYYNILDAQDEDTFTPVCRFERTQWADDVVLRDTVWRLPGNPLK